MSVSRSDFVAVFPEFNDDSRRRQIDMFLKFANRRVSEAAWGDCTDEAVIYLTAHLLAQASGGGGFSGGVAGPITQESVGDLSRSYGQVQVNANGNDELFAQTKYGQLFLELRRSCVLPAMVLNPSIPGVRNGTS